KRLVILDFAVADSIRALGAGEVITGIANGGKVPAYLSEFKESKYTNVG
ncbi:MAG TPA: ABC transporter, partial [Pasteurellaceae bacterium]|nr:ABC transporter [Pasteurellaceae bacterium]